MKILQLIYESLGSPFGFGGAGARAYEIYKRLSRRHEITLLCMKYPEARNGEKEGLKHIFVGCESKSLVRSVLTYTLEAANFVRKHENEFDVIIENFLPSTPFFSKLFTKTPVVLQIQGIMEEHSLKKFSRVYSIPMYISERFYPSLYDQFIFVSDITKIKVMARIKRKANLCCVIPNGINRELLSITAEERGYILFLSRIDTYTKGLDILITAFEQISTRYPGVNLVLAGYEFSRFDDLVSNCPIHLRERIKYAGFVKGDEKVNLLSQATMFVLPSRHESSPISILEAAACGKPVIVSDIPELRFVEDHNFGVCFPSGSAEGLKGKIELLLNNRELRSSLGMRGREFSGRFLWDTIAVQFEAALLAVAGETKSVQEKT
ncbi:MAG: glycosyltransferase family 4 protein [Dissulfurispiraceae bacterium]